MVQVHHGVPASVICFAVRKQRENSARSSPYESSWEYFTSFMSDKFTRKKHGNYESANMSVVSPYTEEEDEDLRSGTTENKKLPTLECTQVVMGLFL